MLCSSKLPSYVTYNQIANINDDPFFFFIIFPKLEHSFWCNIPLRTGVLIISLFFLLCGGSSFYTVWYSNNTYNLISSVILMIIYLIGFIMLCITACNFNYKLATAAYYLYSVVLILNFTEVVVVTILIFGKMYVPNGSENALVKGISFLLVGILLSCVYMYLIWMIFCYALHLKYGRFDLVCGKFGEGYLSRGGDNNRLNFNMNLDNIHSTRNKQQYNGNGGELIGENGDEEYRMLKS